MRISAAFLAAIPLMAAPPFTIRQILSSPFPSEMRTSLKGDAVAWVSYTEGVRNIMIAAAPDFTATQLTHFTQDDGQELSDLAWKPDDSAVYFTRGGGVNGRGESPNPTSNPGGARQEVWVAERAGEVRRIGPGHSPEAAPDGSSVAWVYSGQVWTANMAGEPSPAQAIHSAGFAEDLAWSPDGTRLAYTSTRGDHSFIGVFNPRAKTLIFLDPSADSDRSPAWSGDGRQIAFIRVPASRYAALYGAKRTGEPWSVRVADAVSGKGHQVWRAESGPGSVFWPAAGGGPQLLFTATNRIVFPWERDGWLHLYSIGLNERSPALLTPGAFEVDAPALTPDRTRVVYSSNQDDADRRHLWSVSPDGANARPRPMSFGEGIEWSAQPLAGDRVAFLRSGARAPARPSILDSAGNMRDLTTVPKDFPASALTDPESVILSAADGMRIHGQLFLPRGHGTTKHPAIAFFHGGSRRQMLLGWNPMFYYHQAYGIEQYFAAKGYVVLSVNYRSGIGYGEAFREALNFGPTGASEYNDVVGAGLYLRSRADVDPAHIGIWGGSYGGYLTALGLARASDIFAAGVDLHGVHDWNLEISNPIPAYEAEKRLAVARTAFRSSPMSSVDTWRSPVLLVHGDDDRNVPFAETVQLSEALRQRGVPFEELVFPDEIHDFLVHSHWVQAYEAADGFFDRHLLSPK